MFQKGNELPNEGKDRVYKSLQVLVGLFVRFKREVQTEKSPENVSKYSSAKLSVYLMYNTFQNKDLVLQLDSSLWNEHCI